MSLFSRYSDASTVGFNIKSFLGNITKNKTSGSRPISYSTSSVISDKIYLEKLLTAWLRNEERKIMITGEKYYVGDHDILRRTRKAIGVDGKLQPVDNVINNKLIDNQYKKLVDQKTNYVLGKPLTISTEKDEYLEELNKIFDKRMHRKLKVLAQYAIDGGIAWVYPYYDQDGELDITVFPSYEICPVWKDKSHTELECAIRYYEEQVLTNGGGVDLIKHADVFTKNGIDHYLVRGSDFVKTEIPHDDYMTIGNKGFNWDHLPIIPFKYNTNEIPLIQNVKTLQDALNEMLSDFQNNMQENPRNSILILQNYDGTDLGEFRQNLATYGTIKVTTIDGVKGGVDALRVDVNSTNYQAILMQLKRAIIENGRGFDAKEERMDGDPNQMNIESMYTDIDLDVNGMESEFQASFEEFRWFINQYLKDKTGVDYTDEKVEFVFNRDIFINEDAKINSCVASVGTVSNKTILAHHPWVFDVNRELDQISTEKDEEMKEMQQLNESFGNPDKSTEKKDINGEPMKTPKPKKDEQKK